MRSMMYRIVIGAGLLAAAGAERAPAQATYPSLKVEGRLQVEFYDFNNAGNAAYQALPTSVRAPESSFLIRRARIGVRGQLAENVSFVIQPNYTTGQSGMTLADAYVDVAFTKPEARQAVTLRVGQFKRPFGRYELTTSNNLPTIERGAYRGLVPSASSDLAIGNGYESRDIGAGITYTGAGQRLALTATVMNGALSPNNIDFNGSKSYYARATLALTPRLAIGASYGDHDFVQQPDTALPADSSARNAGFGIDAQWSAPGEKGVYAMVDYLNGESTLDSANRIWGLQMVGAYHIRMKSATSFLYAIEPVVRYDVAEPNNGIVDDQNTLVTAGVSLYLTGNSQIRLMYERQGFEDSTLSTISGFRGALTMHF